MPLPAYKGYWDFSGNPSDQRGLPALADHLFSLEQQGSLFFPLDLERFSSALDLGLYFHSDIPEGYGAGSSGALCAALYQAFRNDMRSKDPEYLKRGFAQLEGFFHGSSSGIDPLVSFLGKALKIGRDGQAEPLSWPQELIGETGLFLVDSRHSRSTSPLVNWYLDQCRDRLFLQRIHSELSVYNENAIHSLLAGDRSGLWEAFHNISFFQFRYLSRMIPDYLRTAWLEGLAADRYRLKLCGAGGGGFMLGLGRLGELPETLPGGFRVIPLR